LDRIIRIVHPLSDSPDAPKAFAHALSLALDSSGELEIIDVRGLLKRHTSPGVRETLERWGRLPQNSSKSSVAELGLKVRKIVGHGFIRSIIKKRLHKRTYDILVCNANQKSGSGKLFGNRLSDFLVRRLHQTTLYIPEGCHSFIDANTGKAMLKNIVIPVPPAADSIEPVFKMLSKIMEITRTESPEVFGVHCGSSFPSIPESNKSAFSWNEFLKNDSPAVAITDIAREKKADLIIMSTNGRDSISQKIMGSITEQVLKKSPCPILAVVA